jgi:peptidoglycan/xylan/chitin deacetylase (PgdA/CDA1 family)
MKHSVNRRQFLRDGLQLCAGVGAAAASGAQILAQTTTRALRRPDRYEDTTILDRKRFTWPGGKSLAVWVIPNVEAFMFDASGATGTSDVLAYSWREYGTRVGLWRIADVMDAAGLKATVALNAGICEVFPKAIEEMKKRGWEMMGHNLTNSRSLRGLPLDEETRVIYTTLQVIERAVGTKVRGWLGTGLGENYTTLDILAEAGVRYTGDWNNDDLPYRMKVKTGEMYALPYGNTINDITFFGAGHSAGEYYQLLVDQFDTLYADSQKIPRVMGIPLHPFHTGQPLHIKGFEKAIQYMKKRDRVWFATGNQIVDAYQAAQT